MNNQEIAKELVRIAGMLMDDGKKKEASFADRTPFQDALEAAMAKEVRSWPALKKQAMIQVPFKKAMQAAEDVDRTLQNMYMREYQLYAG